MLRSEFFNSFCKICGIQYFLYECNRRIIIDFYHKVPMGMMVFRIDLAQNKMIAQADQAVCEQYIKIG